MFVGLMEQGRTHQYFCYEIVKSKKSIDCFVSCGLTWHITDDITRKGIVDNKMQESMLDQILTSDSDIIKQFTLGPPLRGSDHLTAILEVKLYDNVEYLASKKFNWAKCDVPRLISTGRRIDWFYSEEALHCVDSMCGELESKILHAIHHSVPILVQKTTKEGIQYSKSHGRVRNSVVHERKRTVHGKLSTFVHLISISLLSFNLKKNINL